MEESTTYQAILRKGRVAEARRFLFLIGEDKLGPPNESAIAAINALEDAEHLEQLGKRVNHVSNWDELLAVASRRRRNRH
jgi:hypothetical protein